jgi:hypothetical protein
MAGSRGRGAGGEEQGAKSLEIIVLSDIFF